MSGPGGSHRAGSAATNALLLAVTLAVTLGAMELVLRRFYPPRPDLPEPQTRYLKSPLLGWVLPAGAESFSIEAHVRVNSLSLRNEEFPPTKPPGERRVLCLGDSLVFGYGVEAEDTFPAQLERLLDGSDPKARYRVINAGVSGYNTRQELIYLLSEGLALQPDLVVIGFYWNDLLDDDEPLPDIATTPRLAPGAEESRRGRRSIPPWIVNPLRRSIVVYLAVNGTKALWGLLRPPSEEIWVVRRALFAGDDAFLEPYWRATAERLRQIQSAASEHGAATILLFYPMPEQIRHHYPRLRLSDRLQQIWSATGMPYVDLRSDFARAQAQGTTPFIPYDGHPNRLGHSLAARRVYESIRERGLLRSGAVPAAGESGRGPSLDRDRPGSATRFPIREPRTGSDRPSGRASPASRSRAGAGAA